MIQQDQLRSPKIYRFHFWLLTFDTQIVAISGFRKLVPKYKIQVTIHLNYDYLPTSTLVTTFWFSLRIIQSQNMVQWLCTCDHFIQSPEESRNWGPSVEVALRPLTEVPVLPSRHLSGFSKPPLWFPNIYPPRIIKTCKRPNMSFTVLSERFTKHLNQRLTFLGPLY